MGILWNYKVYNENRNRYARRSYSYVHVKEALNGIKDKSGIPYWYIYENPLIWLQNSMANGGRRLRLTLTAIIINIRGQIENRPLENTRLVCGPQMTS